VVTTTISSLAREAELKFGGQVEDQGVSAAFRNSSDHIGSLPAAAGQPDRSRWSLDDRNHLQGR
jgi:hypothetical protein